MRLSAPGVCVCACERVSEGGRGLVQLDLILTTPHTRVKASGAIRIFDYQRQLFVCVCVLLVYEAIGQELSTELKA